MSEDKILQQLKKTAESLGLEMTESSLKAGELFLSMLHKWNQVYNFTAVRNLPAMIERHWVDSLSVAHLVQGDRVLDVGTGPGLPGIPLALYYPDKSFCLLDSNQKRQLFLQQVTHQANIQNVSLYCGRVEKFFPQEKFHCIMSRAFRALPEMLALTKHLLEPEGIVLAMKGKLDDDELAGLDKDFEVVSIISLATSEKDKPRNAVVLKLTK